MNGGFADFMPLDQQLFERSMGELLASFVRKRWPRDTSKHVAKAWGIDPTTATNLTKGHASERTITKAVRAEGWPLLMALGEAVTGQPYDQFLQSIIDERERAARRAEERRDHLRQLEARASFLVAMDRGEGADEGV